jgi:hypothetical protein
MYKGIKNKGEFKGRQVLVLVKFWFPFLGLGTWVEQRIGRRPGPSYPTLDTK